MVKAVTLTTRTFNNLREVKNRLTQWFSWYNQERFHQGLANQTPDEVYYRYNDIQQAAGA